MNARPTLPALAGIAALAAFTIFITWRAKLLETSMQRETRAIRLVNKPAPDFSLHSLDGQTVSLADFRGKKKLVISFWASWCGPCRLEMPTLRGFYQKNHKESSGFEMVAISTDDDRDAAQSFATETKIPFPVLIDPNGKAASAYGVVSIPMIFVIDESGKVLFGHVGFTPTLEMELANELGIKATMRGGLNAGPGH